MKNPARELDIISWIVIGFGGLCAFSSGMIYMITKIFPEILTFRGNEMIEQLPSIKFLHLLLSNIDRVALLLVLVGIIYAICGIMLKMRMMAGLYATVVFSFVMMLIVWVISGFLAYGWLQTSYQIVALYFIFIALFLFGSFCLPFLCVKT